MHYTQLFRSLREAKGLTLEELAKQAKRHRNTVTNLESGRPVKFKTIAELMEQMGYAASSPEMKAMALLWLEAVSGLPFSKPDTEPAARKAINLYQAGNREAARYLERVTLDANLTPSQISLLVFAAQNPGVLSILKSVRDLAAELKALPDPSPGLEAAEDT